MSSDSVQVEPLDVDNYASWMPQMKYYLIGKDLWDIVENGGNSDDDKKKDKEAIAAIGLRVKKHHLNTVEKAGTAKGLWETFQAQSFTELPAFGRYFASLHRLARRLLR